MRTEKRSFIEGHAIYKPIIYTMIGMGLRIGEVLDISTMLGKYTGVTSDVMKQAAEGADEAMRGMMS